MHYKGGPTSQKHQLIHYKGGSPLTINLHCISKTSTYVFLYEYLIIRKIWKNIHQCAASTASPFRHKIRSHISCSTKGRVARLFGGQKELCKYVLEVLWGQPIKLIQVVSTSEFYECWVKTLQEPEGTLFKTNNKVLPSIFMKFWSRYNLNKLDCLTPQDL